MAAPHRFTHASARAELLAAAEALQKKADDLRDKEALEQSSSQARKRARVEGSSSSSGSGGGGGGGSSSSAHKKEGSPGEGAGQPSPREPAGGSSGGERRAAGALDAASAARAKRLLGGLLVGTLAEARRAAQLPELASASVAEEAEAARMAAMAALVYASEKALFRSGRRFLRTAAQPPLFWKPRKSSRRLEDALEAQEERMAEELRERERALARLKPREAKAAQQEA